MAKKSSGARGVIDGEKVRRVNGSGVLEYRKINSNIWVYNFSG